MIGVGGGEIPFDQGSGNNVDVSGLGSEGLARLQTCAADHPGLQLWLLDADGSVGPASSDE